MSDITMEYSRVEAKLAVMNGRSLDKYDYILSAFFGAAAGIIDIIFVGSPADSKLGKFTDKAADELVKKTAQMFWKFDPRNSDHKSKRPESLVQCISYLEQAFPVSYDARYAKDLYVGEGQLQSMSPADHHLLSLAHSPDIIGLIFSIIDQFTDMASFIDNGEVIRVRPRTKSKAVPYLQGTTFISRIYCGIINWMGHLLSDLVGSSSTRRKESSGRGSGIPMPFYDLLLLCNIGDFDGDSIADIAVEAFKQGYDLRFSVAMAIPVIINDLSIRAAWVLKNHFYHGEPLENCIPTDKHAELRMMIILGNGTLCLLDSADAAARSNGNIINFVLRSNLIAWFKLIKMVLKEIMIQYSFDYNDLKIYLQHVNAELKAQIELLEAIDYQQYQLELQELDQLNCLLEDETASMEPIYNYLERSGMDMQFHNFEEFDQKMKDDDFILKI